MFFREKTSICLNYCFVCLSTHVFNVYLNTFHVLEQYSFGEEMSVAPVGKRNIVCSSLTGQGQLEKDMDWQSKLTPKIDYSDYNHADGGL